MEGTDKSRNGLLDIPGFCAYVPGMTRSIAAQLRYNGKGPKFIKPSPKLVVYRKSDVDAWLQEHEQTITE